MDELKSTRDHLEMTEEKLKICKDDMMQQSETLEVSIIVVCYNLGSSVHVTI